MSDDKIEILKSYSNIGEMIGYIKVEKIGVNLPIYDGTEDKVLLKGIGRMNLSNNHTILAGHTGLADKIMFDNLTNLEIGDLFCVTIFEDIFNYKICDIQQVLPDEMDYLKKFFNENGEFVTLVTCSPRYINSHRLLVTGKLLENCDEM